MSKISLALKIFGATFLIGNPLDKLENFDIRVTKEIVKVRENNTFTSIHPIYKNAIFLSESDLFSKNDTVHILKTINGGLYMIIP